jgi:hypothetical protein
MPKGCRKGHFHRGFPVPHLGAFSIAGLVRLGAERLRAAPLWTYHYGVYGRDLDPLLAWPWLHRLKLFALRSPVPDDWADRLAECDNLRNVSELDLLDWKIPADELRRLLDVWAGRHLSTLRASASLPGDFVTVLVDHPTAGSLRRLDLSYRRLSRDDVARFARGRQITNLVELGIGDNGFGDEGLAELLAWPGLARLRWLNLCGNALTNEGVKQLAACPAVASLRTLLLSENQIDIVGAGTLAASPHLEGLEKLSLYKNPAGAFEASVRVLKRLFGKRVSF